MSVGPQEMLRAALAMGAVRAILVQTDDEVEPLAVAKIPSGMAMALNGDGLTQLRIRLYRDDVPAKH